MGPEGYILVIDDDAAVRTTVAGVLADAGYEVVTAAQGEEALQRLSDPSSTPHLILLDLVMPGMSGQEFRKVQQRYLRWASIPVVILSGFASPEQAAELGAAAVLAKPVDAESLLAAVEQHRRHSHV